VSENHNPPKRAGTRRRLTSLGASLRPAGRNPPARRGRLRSQIKKLRLLLSKKDAGGAQKELGRTLALLDKSIGTGIIHRNAAARHKSRLTRQVNALQGGR